MSVKNSESIKSFLAGSNMPLLLINVNPQSVNFSRAVSFMFNKFVYACASVQMHAVYGHKHICV